MQLPREGVCLDMEFSVIIREPFQRTCFYRFSSREEAHSYINTLSVVLGLEVDADVVPAEMLNQVYDA